MADSDSELLVTLADVEKLMATNAVCKSTYIWSY